MIAFSEKEVVIMVNEELFDVLTNLIDEKKYTEFKEEIYRLYPADAAAFLNSLPDERVPAFFRLLGKDMGAEVFAELDGDAQEKLIKAMTDSELGQITSELYTDDVVDILEELPAGIVSRIMRQVSPEDRATINRYLAYPEDSAGSIMTSEYATLRTDMTVGEATDHIRKTGYDKETVYTLFVTDSERHLIGTIELSDLLFGALDSKIINVTDKDTAFVLTTDDREYVAEVIAKYDLLSLPVVDSEQRLVGIVTVDDAVDVIKEEATEDIVKMAAVTPTDKPYLKTDVLSIFRRRIPWLLLLMISATFTGGIITHYEAALGAYVVLTSFIPMLMDTGGNAGGQASVTIIRGISLGEIMPRDIWRILWKEFRVAILCGITLALAAFAKAMLIDRVEMTVAIVVALTLFMAVITAKLVGSTLPILAKLLRLDPAVMASPFITTIVDAVSLMIYFRIATVFLDI